MLEQINDILQNTVITHYTAKLFSGQYLRFLHSFVPTYAAQAYPQAYLRA